MVISKHIIFSSTVDYGRSRPQACLAASCVLQDPTLLVTLLVPQSAFGLLKSQIDKMGLSSEQTIRLRMKAIGSAVATMTHEREKPYYDAFETEFPQLIQEEPRPCALVYDLQGYRAAEFVESLKLEDFSLWVSYPSLSPALLQILLPKEAQPGPRRDEHDNEMFTCPGVVALYEGEDEACKLPFEIPGGKATLIKSAFSSIQSSKHGIVTTISLAFQREANIYVQSWIESNLHKPLIFTGFHYPHNVWAGNASLGSNSVDIASFLDSKPAKSVLFINWGSIFYPEIDQLECLVDCLLEKKFNFLLVKSSGSSKAISDEAMKNIESKIQASGYGVLIKKWVDQQAILNHPSIGWVLGHGGASSTLETLLSGLPLILWPHFGDQPTNSAYCTFNIDVAFELLQHRRNRVGKKSYNHPNVEITGKIEDLRREILTVFDKLEGPEGMRKRENADRIGRELKEDHDRNGTQYVQDFLDKM